MSTENKNRILTWIASVGVAMLFLLISSCTATNENPNRTTILIKAPDLMVTAFQNAFDRLGWSEDYILEATNDINKANFVVREGMNQKGELIAYSPIVAVFNSDSDYEESLIEKGIFVKSELNESDEDFDFYKVIQEAISGTKCEFKIYYPSKDSNSWDEFYNFMLFSVNDGYYPGTDKEMEDAKHVVEKFLNSKYAEPFNNNTIQRSNGIAKNSIYFMAYADLARVYKQSGGFSCRVMYPKTVVYHSYYATYDELGKVVYDSLEADNTSFFEGLNNVGYAYLRDKGYNTKYSNYVTSIGNAVWGLRTTFNGVEIPGAEIYIYNEEAKKDE